MWQKMVLAVSAFFGMLFGKPNTTPPQTIPVPTVYQESDSKFPQQELTPTTKPTPKATSTPTIPPLRKVTYEGFAYEDRNNDGIFNSDDPKLAYMQFFLYDSYAPTVQLSTVFTDTAGKFIGSLDVRKKVVIKPTAYNNYTPKSSSQEISQNSTNLQFGFRTISAPVVNQVNGILEGDIFQDTNQNRSRDNGEASVYFYKLYLQNESGSYYNTIENAQATDAGGHFKFINLPTGHTYTVRLSNPTGDYTIFQTEYTYSLTSTQTQYTNIQIPVLKN